METDALTPEELDHYTKLSDTTEITTVFNPIVVKKLTQKIHDQNTTLKSIGEVLSEFGCEGKCAHDACYVVESCGECGLRDIDEWCLACRIQHVMKTS